MRHLSRCLCAAVLLLAASPAFACGFGEAPSGCGDASDAGAKYMLARVVTAMKADEGKALADFQKGQNGFRTVDTYVFCVGPDGIMTAHPNPVLQGQNVRDLHDQTGNYFIKTMMDTAKPGVVSEIHYLFPRPGQLVAEPKTTYYTKAADQVCAVGAYGDEDTQAATPAATPEQRLATLRQRLSAGMPATLAGDWTAFQRALDERDAARAAQLTKAADGLQAVGTALQAAR